MRAAPSFVFAALVRLALPVAALLSFAPDAGATEPWSDPDRPVRPARSRSGPPPASGAGSSTGANAVSIRPLRI